MLSPEERFCSATQTLQYNIAGQSGGAIIVEAGAIHISNSHSRDNDAGIGDGGGLSISIGEATLQNTSISDNTADGNGGAVSVTELATLRTLGGVSLLRNTAVFDGGGIDISDATVDLDAAVSVQLNNAGLAGGGILISGNSVLTLNGSMLGLHINLNTPDNLVNNGGTVNP